MKGFMLVLVVSLVGVAVAKPKVGGNGPSVRSPVGKCPEKDPGNPVFLPDGDDCGLYYECSNGVPVENNCAPGLEWSTKLNTCVAPSESGCTAGNHQSTNAPPTTLPPLYFDAVGECPVHDNNNTIYLPDSDNCTIYYVCSNGRPIALHCPENMEFSPSKQVCVLDIDSDCEGGGAKMEISPRKPVGTCPEKDPANPIFLPDSENCQIYYECSNGEAVENSCAGELVWDPKKNTCVKPQDYDCKSSGGSSSTEPDATTSSF